MNNEDFVLDELSLAAVAIDTVQGTRGVQETRGVQGTRVRALTCVPCINKHGYTIRRVNNRQKLPVSYQSDIMGAPKQTKEYQH